MKNNGLCIYKNSLGIPGQGIHKDRIFGLAFWDIFFTVIGSYIIHKYSDYNFWKVLVSLFAIGIIMHLIFCVETPITKLITQLCHKNL